MSRRLTLLAAGLVLVLAAAVVLWYSTPQLVTVSPGDQALEVPADASLRLSFSRPMQPDSVQDRLTLDPFRAGRFSWQGNELTFTPDQPWQPGERVQVTLAAGARAAGLFQLPMRSPVSWGFSMRRLRLAYLFPADAASNIFLLDPNSGESVQITDSLTGVLDFDVAISGDAIYYAARVGQGGSTIYRLDLTTPESAPISILDCPKALCTSPRIAPAGNYLAYERTAFPGNDEPGYPQVWLLPLTVGNSIDEPDTATVTAGQPALAGELLDQSYQPQWSPDGWLATYDSTLKAYILQNPDNGQRSQFPNQTGQLGSWHPTGQYFVAPEILDNLIIAPTTDPASFPVVSSHLIRFNRQDSSTLDLTNAQELEDTAPAYSPDGALLAFSRKYLLITQWTPGRQLWLMSAEGQGARAMTNDPNYNHYDFAWSPGGSQIAYVRFNQTIPTEPPEIWLLEIQSGRTGQFVIGGYAPHWVP